MGDIVLVGSVPSLRDLLEKMRPQVMLAAAKHLDANRVLRVTLTAVQRDSKLLQCSEESLLRSLMTCTQLGLEPDGRLAYLVPYGTECKLVIGYPGLIELAIRSGAVRNIVARVVRAGDTFEYQYGTDEFIKHTPGETGGELTHAYSIAFLAGGGCQFDVMTRKEIDVIKARASAQRGPWSHETDYFEMARKTPVRRLCKYLPASPEASRAAQLDEQAELGLPQDLLPLNGSMAALPAPTRTQEAKDKAKQLRPEPPPETPQPVVDEMPDKDQTIFADQYGDLKRMYDDLSPDDKLRFRKNVQCDRITDLRTLPVSQWEDVHRELFSAWKLGGHEPAPPEERPQEPPEAEPEAPRSSGPLSLDQLAAVRCAFDLLPSHRRDAFRVFAGITQGAMLSVLNTRCERSYDELLAKLQELRGQVDRDETAPAD